MEYESVGSAAKRWQVTPRTVQKWAKEGKIPGARKEGRDWMIPVKDDSEHFAINNVDSVKRIPMILLNTSFPLGKCEEIIETIKDEDMRHLVRAEYLYFSGKTEEASRVLEPYLESKTPSVQMTAGFLCIFSNMINGHLHLMEFSLKMLREELDMGLAESGSSELCATTILFRTATSVVTQLDLGRTYNLVDYIPDLPNGLKLLAYYMMAYKAYMRKDYAYSLGMVDGALMMYSEIYPIAHIFLHLMASMNLMSMMRVDEAKQRFMEAWKLAKADHLIEPFAEHHGLLQGMIEVNLKKDYPVEYEEIIEITKKIRTGWHKAHSKSNKENSLNELTTTEFTIAMLYNRGWRAKEIAAYMGLSVRTIGNYIQVIYQKLNIKGKKELRDYMNR